MIFTSLSYKILGLDFISGLAWLKWKPPYSACGHQLCSLNLLGDPQAISPSYFHGFIPSSIRSRSLPAKFPQAISTASSRPASGLAPSQRSFPKRFPRLHPVEHPVSLPPSEVSPSYFPKLFTRLHPVEHPDSLPPSEVSPSDFHGFIPSSIRSRSLPAKFPQAIISTASSRPASGLAPSQRSFPKRFPRLHPVEHPVSLPPSEVSPSYFPKLFPRLHPVEHPVSLPPSEVSPSYFHGFIPSSIRSRSLPAKFPQATWMYMAFSKCLVYLLNVSKF